MEGCVGVVGSKGAELQGAPMESNQQEQQLSYKLCSASCNVIHGPFYTTAQCTLDKTFSCLWMRFLREVLSKLSKLNIKMSRIFAIIQSDFPEFWKQGKYLGP